MCIRDRRLSGGRVSGCRQRMRSVSLPAGTRSARLAPSLSFPESSHPGRALLHGCLLYTSPSPRD
eukprot:6518414-Alexandrium_andersonii.AAC.1